MLDPNELIVDSFAGGGGASLGIAWALGRAPDIAINHCADAIKMHEANHPSTMHVREDVWRTDLKKLVGRRPVGLLHASPDLPVGRPWSGEYVRPLVVNLTMPPTYLLFDEERDEDDDDDEDDSWIDGDEIDDMDDDDDFEDEDDEDDDLDPTEDLCDE